MPPRPITPDSHPYTALVVDDDAILRTVLRQVLEHNQCRVLEAEHGRQAVEVFCRQPVDIVLLDVMMPVMNGIEACGHIRAAPGGQRVPILITTALDDTNSVNQAFAAGATDFITKPLHLAVVRQRVSRLLQTRRAEDAIERAKLEWEATFDAVHDLIFIVDEAGQIVRCNHAASRKLGQPFSELIGRAISPLLLGSDAGLPTALAAGHDLHLPRLSGWFRVTAHTVSVHDRPHQAYVLRDITDEKAAQDRIRSLARFPEENPAPVLRIAADGTLIYANTAGRWLMEDWGCALGEHVPPVWRERVRQGLKEDALQGYELEGRSRSFAVTLTPIREEGYANLYCRDVTQQKQAEARLRENERRYRAIVEVQTEMICRWTPPDAVITFANDAYARSMGRPVEALLGNSFLEFLSADDRPGARARLDELLATLTPHHPMSPTHEQRVKHPDGHVAWEQWTERAIFDDAGQLLEVQTVGRDITARKLAEALLRESEARFRSLFEDAPVMYLRLRHDAAEPLIAGANRRFLERLGYGLDEVVGRPLNDFYSAAARQESLSPADDAQPWPDGRGVERQLVAKSGELIETIEHTAPEHDVSGAVVGTRAAFTDVTERKQLQSQMLAASKLADLGTLAAGVAHEINSPLQVITGLSQSWLHKLEQEARIDPDRLRRNLDTIHRNGWRCAEIVRSLRTYAHAGGHQFETNDLNSVVRDSLLLIEHQLNKWSNITVTTRYAPDLPPFACDRNQITQVIINLLTNARDAMPNGGAILIRTATETATGRLLLGITDTGSGVPDHVKARIFDPFFTTKPIGKGTGLGLAIVSGIVRAHCGEVGIESPPGRGATFQLSFPPHPAGAPLELKRDAEAVGRFDDALGSFGATSAPMEGVY